MSLSALWIAAALLAAAVPVALVARSGEASAGQAPEARNQPVLVELFTSEGCSSCPPADALLLEYNDRQPFSGREVIALGHHVDYWDRLGWVDPFSSKESTNRQSAYAQSLNLNSVYTPQMIVNGKAQFVGSDARLAKEAISAARQLPLIEAALAASGENEIRVTLTLPTGLAPGPVFVAVTESGLETDVRRGENAGRKLKHAPILRLLQEASIPRGTGSDGKIDVKIALDPKWNRKRLRVAAFAQSADKQPVTALSRSVSVSAP